ncbi:MAG: methyltransferase domain-containing protein [Blastocatellia bacterium]
MPDQFGDNDVFRANLDQTVGDQRSNFISSGWWHSIDLGDGRITAGVHSVDSLRDNYARFNLPEDLTGKRVLDIGCWDGFYSFEAERHGAEVVAIDCWRPETMLFARREMNSRVEFHEMSVYELSPEKFGLFDIVLFLGVLYHVPYPLLALRRVCEMSRDLAVIETHVIDGLFDTPLPVMEFYELDELGGQYDNWWGPNSECVVRMARAAGFARAETLRLESARVVVKGYRRWEEKPLLQPPALRVRDVVNSVMLNRQLSRRGRFALLSIFVEGLPAGATRETIRVRVGAYDSNPIHIIHPMDSSVTNDTRLNRLAAPGVPVEPVIIELAASCAQIITPVPPGLDAGPVTLQVRHEGKQSGEFPILLSESSEW